MNRQKMLLISATALSLALCDGVAAGRIESERIENELLEKTTPTVQARSVPQIIVEQTAIEFKDNFLGKLKTSYNIARGIKNGDFSLLTSEIVEVLIAELAGSREVSLFKGRNTEFDQETLTLAANKLSDLFFNNLRNFATKRKDIYGTTSSGEHVTIFDNKTVLGIFAEKVIPQSVPFREIMISALNVEIIEKAIREEFNSIITQFILNLAKNKGISIKETVGQVVQQTVKKVIKNPKKDDQPKTAPLTNTPPAGQEDSVAKAAQKPVELPAILQYMKPRLTYYLRTFMLETLYGTRSRVLDYVDTHLRSPFVKVSRGIGVVTTYVAGSALEMVGHCLPYVGGLIKACGSVLKSPYSTLTVGNYMGGLAGNSVFKSTVDTVSPKMDATFRGWAYKLLGLSQEEHALYSLNTAPSDIERGLFFEDYEARTRLQSQTFVVSLLKTISQSTGISKLTVKFSEAAQKFLDIFKKDKGISVEEAMRTHGLEKHLSSEQKARFDARIKAYRRLLLLPPLRREEVLQDIQKYPSYTMRVQLLKGETNKPKNQKSVDQEVVEKLQITACEILRKEKSVQLKEEDKVQLTERLLDLSVEEQNLLAGLTSEERKKVLENVQNPKNMQDLVKMTVSHALALKEAQYIEKNKDTLASLKKFSLVEGLTETETVKVHQKLQAANKLDAVLGEVETASTVKSNTPPQEDVEKIKKYYINILSRQRGKKLFDLLKTQLEQMGAVGEIKEVAKKIKEKPLDQAVSTALHGNKKYETIMSSIRVVRSKEIVRSKETVYKDELTNVFAALKKKWETELAQQMETETQNTQTKTPEKSQSLLSSFFPGSSKEPEPKALSADEIWKAVHEDEKELKAFQGEGEDVVGEFNLVEFVNKAKAYKDKDLVNLDLEQVAKDIFEDKKSTLTEEEKTFVNKYASELFAYKVKDKSLQGRVFYGLQELIQKIRDRNHKRLTKLFSQKENNVE